MKICVSRIKKKPFHFREIFLVFFKKGANKILLLYILDKMVSIQAVHAFKGGFFDFPGYLWTLLATSSNQFLLIVLGL
jgi:hypothetical protein